MHSGVANPWTTLLDQGLVINRHRHRLAHFRMAGQHRVVEVEVQRLEAGTGGRRDERIVAEALVRPAPCSHPQKVQADVMVPACRSLRVAS